MVGALRSELVRLRRPGLLLSWLGLAALFAVLLSVVMPNIVADATGTPTDGPGTDFPTLAQLTSSDGLVAAMSSGASFFGIVTLAFWAITAATDHTTGLVRLLVSAQPSRWRLLAGKVGALMAWTAVATTLIAVLTVVVAPIGAHSAGVDTDAWRSGAASTVASAWLDLYAASLVWGTIGLVLATLTRSSSIAIAGGVAYVLIVEAIVEAAVPGVGDWLPGNTLTALAQGGNESVSFGAAAALGAAYVLGGLALTLVVTRRRDVTE